MLKHKISELTHENNRYHLAISNCTFCASDDDPDTSDASISFDASIRASTPVSSASLNSGDPALSPRTIPALMSLTIEDRKQVEADTVVKSKHKTFISRMVKTLNKLETKYLTPEHKRKKRLFTRTQKTSSIVPREFSAIYNVLAAPEPDTVPVHEPIPHVRWSEVWFKPALPNPELCPVYSRSQDPEFYQEKREYWHGSKIPTVRDSEFLSLSRQYGRPFGGLPGYRTSLGVVAIPTTPVGGYVYSPEVKKWVLYAEPQSSPSAGRGTRRGGTPPARRRRG